MILLKNTHMPLETDDTHENQGAHTDTHAHDSKKRLAWLAFRCLIILMALLDIYYEHNWMTYFCTYPYPCEWFQDPPPNYGNLMEYRHAIRLFCNLFVIIWAIQRNDFSSHSMLGQKWKPGQSLVLLFFISNLAILGMDIIYDIRWLYTFGWHNFELWGTFTAIQVWEIVIAIIMIIVWVLFLLNILPPLCFISLIAFEWSFYYCTNIKDIGSEGLWPNSYRDIVEKGIFALIMILFVTGTRLINFDYEKRV